MTLISSISGIRGTIGGAPGSNLTPSDILRFSVAYARWIKQQHDTPTVVIGRDGRISGAMVNKLVCGALQSMGVHVTDIGLSTTPTVEMAVVMEAAQGGIILTASHNPAHWNALKLLNQHGEFISAAEGAVILQLAGESEVEYATVDLLGRYTEKEGYIARHIEKILALPEVNVPAITQKKFKVVVDAVHSTGGISIPPLLKALGVAEVIGLYMEPTGVFPHDPEPLSDHLGALKQEVKLQKADLGIAVDPDVDRLVMVCENGEMFGEEYTLVSVADYILKAKPGPVVSNLSSTRALGDVANRYGVVHHQSAVGEVHVVEKMKAVGAVIGGEGNGGIIVPDLHYGRDALAGIALFLSHLATSGFIASRLRASYPTYHMAKKKIDLPETATVKEILAYMSEKYKQYPQDLQDGLKVNIDTEWFQLRASNTEPILRIYTESHTKTTADNMAQKVMSDIQQYLSSPKSL